MKIAKLAFAVLLAVGLGLPARAADIIEEWANVQMPPAPALKQVTLDPKTTALLVIDMVKETCDVRPRCTESVPAVQKVLNEAQIGRAHV